MDKKYTSKLSDLLGAPTTLDYISPETIPNIDLYMEQITSFMDKSLAGSKRYPDDKILTKTMINNYTKNNLIPPPTKKKYSKEHLLLLIFVYYMKDFLSISDIRTALKPMTERFFNNPDGISLSDIYDTIFQLEKKEAESIPQDILRIYELAESAFPDADPEDEDCLKTFAFICSLSFDVYIKKQLIERLLDRIGENGNTETDSGSAR